MIDIRRRSFLFGAAAALAVPARTIYMPPSPKLVITINCLPEFDYQKVIQELIASITGIPAYMLTGERT